MAEQLWSQDVFSKGELSPLMYTRVSVEAFYRGLMTAQNVLSYPQGAAGKRFGTVYVNEITSVTNYTQIYFKSFQYLNECVYLVVIKPNAVDIFLEGMLVATVVTTLGANEIPLIDHTVLQDRFIVCTGQRVPQQLRRAPDAANAITGFASTTLTLTTPGTVGFILPCRFTGTTLPTSNPQLLRDKTYFCRFITTTTVEVYLTATDAKAQTNKVTFSTAGTAANLVTQNTWTFGDITFRNLPLFDFAANYDTATFTLSATTGAITITSSVANTFTTENVNGSFEDGIGGVAKITGFVSGTVVNATVLSQFDSTTVLPGLAFLTVPAWSSTRGWPRKCSSFQNRSWFANTDSLPNGLWGSVINSYYDFNEYKGDADYAIGWLPTSDQVNYIQFIVPYRSLTIHTNSGIYSTPLSFETALTPANFSMQLQDSTPAESVQPTGIDNQIIVISGNDVHSMLWDGINNAYNANIISIANEQLIRNPIDQASFVDLERAGSRYIFIIDEDGTLALYQTLISENVSGFTPSRLTQSYGNAYFRWVTSNFDGRAWFVTERQIAAAATPVAITVEITIPPSSIVTATGSNFSTTEATAVRFTTAGSLPTSSPQIAVDTYYWAIGIDADTFRVYVSKADAEAGENAITYTAAGSSSNVVPYPLSTKFFIEEISNRSYVDCAGFYNGAATDTISGQSRFEAQDIVMNGDGFGFSNQVIDGDVIFESHGMLREVSEAQYGFPIDFIVEPMPMAVPIGGNYKATNLLEPKHVRSATLVFADTIGGYVNGQAIAMQSLTQNQPGSPPAPYTGTYKVSLLKGWNDFMEPIFTLTHSEPFDIKLTGVFYKIDV